LIRIYQQPGKSADRIRAGIAAVGDHDLHVIRQVCDVSRGGSTYARHVLGIPVRDLTGGFKCFRRKVLETIDLGSIHTGGYGFQIELTYRAIQAGFRVVEVPIVFRDRQAGVSKMSARIAVEAVWKVPALRMRRP